MAASGSRTLAGALNYAKSQVGKSGWRRLCLAFVRSCWGIAPSGIPSAAVGWSKTKHRHTDKNPPPGAPVWWDGPTAEDHVALSAGGGYVYSNDILSPGRIDKVKIDTITSRWGARYRGWSEDYPNFGRLPLDLVSESKPPKDSAPEVGQVREVSTSAGLNARLSPGGKIHTTVAKGYKITVHEVKKSGGHTWIRGAKYWYASEYTRLLKAAPKGPKVGEWRVVTTAAGLNARFEPDGRIKTTVAKGYRIKVHEVRKHGGRTWIRGSKYWYASEYTKKES